jgi:membrane-associated protease RseP (regulator of RpoE activity)
MIRFTFFGMPVEIQPWFWVIMALLGTNFGRSASGGNEALMIALFVIAGALSIFVHELGHALTGKMFKARPFIVLHGFGGFAAFPGSHFTRMQSFLVTAAGPLVQIALGVLAFAALFVLKDLSESFQHFIGFLFSVSIFWALLNLIPVYPLDGGQMMAAMLGPQRRKLCLQLSIGVAVCAAIALWVSGIGVFMPFFMLYFAYQNYQELKETFR